MEDKSNDTQFVRKLVKKINFIHKFLLSSYPNYSLAETSKRVFSSIIADLLLNIYLLTVEAETLTCKL